MSTETKKGNTEKLSFEITIKATPAKVWQVLWNDSTYRKWSSAFCEGSYAISDWKEGSKVQFIGPNGDGMYGIITVCKPKEQMTFKHLGELKGFKEQPESAWSGSIENYSLKEGNGTVKLQASLDSTLEFKDYFTQTFPKAMNLIKELSEKPIEITVEAVVNSPVEKVWKAWTTPEDIIKWNTASDDWHTTRAENDLRAGGKFSSRMEAKDGSFGFDFEGVHNEVKPNELIASTMGDGRRMRVTFIPQGNSTKVVETFEAESENTLELQQGGWQAILNNFKKYTESK